jgi:SpoVK/Ycf46/Vps4 family AAA+-type ATPase
VTSLITNTLRAQGCATSTVLDDADLPGQLYDPAFLHTDVELEQVVEGLGRSHSGRLCLCGPPGTGKTAFARYLAERLGHPVHSKSASRLLSKWVGDSEKNVARAFEAAAQEQAILVIDEADSLLIERRASQANWEVSLTNEFLTQMEAFPGILVASTNMLEGLDEASLRRFDLKVRFDFLTSEQAWQLLCHQCSLLDVPDPEPELRHRMDALSNLTPGDFAAVRRRHRLQPLHASVHWVSALEGECALKRGHRNRIGF